MKNIAEKYIYFHEKPQVSAIYYVDSGVMYHNLSANKDAKIIYMKRNEVKENAKTN